MFFVVYQMNELVERIFHSLSPLSVYILVLKLINLSLVSYWLEKDWKLVLLLNHAVLSAIQK